MNAQNYILKSPGTCSSNSLPPIILGAANVKARCCKIFDFAGMAAMEDRIFQNDDDLGRFGFGIVEKKLLDLVGTVKSSGSKPAESCRRRASRRICGGGGGGRRGRQPSGLGNVVLVAVGSIVCVGIWTWVRLGSFAYISHNLPLHV